MEGGGNWEVKQSNHSQDKVGVSVMYKHEDPAENKHELRYFLFGFNVRDLMME